MSALEIKGTVETEAGAEKGQVPCMRRRGVMKFVRIAVAAFLVASAVSIVSAQTGGISVKVIDSTGEPLPAATVTITHPTGYVKEAATLTNAKGLAVFPVLRATGQSSVGYTLNIVFPGFAPMQVTDVKVSMGQTTKQPVQLAEEIVERVTVVATTDVVVAWPTPTAPPVMRRPQWHPVIAMTQAKQRLLVRPVARSPMFRAETVWLR